MKTPAFYHPWKQFNTCLATLLCHWVKSCKIEPKANHLSHCKKKQSSWPNQTDNSKTNTNISNHAYKKSETRQGRHEARGSAPTLVGPSWAPWPSSFAYIYSYALKTSRGATKPLFHCRNLLFLWDPILGPFPAPCRRGIRSRRASTSTLLPFWWSVSSLPQTYGSIASS